jgi:hypothetical protein
MAGHENDDRIVGILEKWWTCTPRAPTCWPRIREHIASEGEPEQTVEWEQFVASHPRSRIAWACWRSRGRSAGCP